MVGTRKSTMQVFGTPVSAAGSGEKVDPQASSSNDSSSTSVGNLAFEEYDVSRKPICDNSVDSFCVVCGEYQLSDEDLAYGDNEDVEMNSETSEESKDATDVDSKGFTQEELNDLVRDAGLSKEISELTDLEWAISLNRMMMKIIGLWPPDNQDPRKIVGSKLRLLYTFIALLCVLAIPVLASLIRIWGDMILMINNLQCSLSILMTIFKICIIWYKQEALASLIDMIKNDWIKMKMKEEQDVMLMYATITRKVAMCGMFLILSSLMISVVLPWFGLTVRQVTNLTDPGKPLPLQSYYLHDVSKSPQFELTFLAQGIVMFATCLSYSAVDNFLGLLVIHVCGQLENLHSRLSHMDKFPDFNAVLKYNVQDHIRLIREVADDLNISFGSCQSILKDVLGMTRVSAKFVPKLLNFDQKQHRMNIAQDMLNDVNDDPDLLKRVITGDESWVYGYDVETKAQSSQWKSPGEPRPKKARQVRSNVKVLLTVFFDYHGIVHREFLPQDRTPPYSPDLAACDFFLFSKLKMPMKGRRFVTIEKIKAASLEELKVVKQREQFSFIQLGWNVAAVIYFLLHMFLYCAIGEILVIQSEKIHRATYEYAWYTTEPIAAKNLLLIMLRSNKPLHITAGKTFPMTMATLCSLLKTSAGYISVLLANQN
ncbi:PREDICTED: uncharacterized protein LOC106747216 [Dinoponera quadriceps]|uniref:Uncharacterized protein LOC106747216 n=1 Tax=Dinoponera quadriceps TaxID=609295 RepID=A0A6P3XNK3_DINQU|nr:PREDICTED: uncharacterized protein LOC106747216 [Dinoponera quadriceps]